MHTSVSTLGDTSFSLKVLHLHNEPSLNFRGLLGASIKVSQENMVTNLQAELVPLSLGNGTGFVHRGFQARL